MISYPIELTPDDNETFMATCPDLPGVVTYGETEGEAMRWAADAIEEHIAMCLHEFRPIARPGDGALRAPISLHASVILELYWALGSCGWSRADLQRALGWHRPQVDRLFDLRHEPKVSRIQAAFTALGREPDIVHRAAA